MNIHAREDLVLFQHLVDIRLFFIYFLMLPLEGDTIALHCFLSTNYECTQFKLVVGVSATIVL